MKCMKNAKTIIAVLAIAFVVYNAVLFALCGFAGHGVAFWLSFGFMMVAFLFPTVGCLILGKRGLSLRDWLFGFPLLKHSAVYLAVEFAVSTLFIVLGYFVEVKWGIVFAPQFVILGVYLAFVISCLSAKRTIDELHTKVKDKTTFIRLLKVDADMLVNSSESAEAKKVFGDFAEEVRYSDPMSSESLFEHEKEISLAVAQAGEKLASGDEAAAIALCRKASRLLSERNEKTKALK